MSTPYFARFAQGHAGFPSDMQRQVARAAKARGIRVEMVSDPVQLERRQVEWLALAANAAEANPLYEAAAGIAAQRYLAEARGARWLFVWRIADSELIAVFPLTYKLSRPLGVATMMHHLYGFLTTPLVHRDHARAALSALLDWCEMSPRGPWLLGQALAGASGPVQAMLVDLLAARRIPHRFYARHTRACLASEADGETYLRRALGGKRLKEYRRLKSRLGEQGTLAFEMIEQPDQLTAAAAAQFALEEKGWKGARGTAVRQRTAWRRFFHELIAGAGAIGGCRIARLTLDGRLIASVILLTSGRTAFLWKIAYNEAFARYSPGVLLVLDLTRQLLDDQAFDCVDSCAIPDHPMIDRIWRERLAINDLLIVTRPGPLPPVLVFALESLRRKARALAKRAIVALRHRRAK